MAKFNVTRKDALSTILTFARDNNFNNEDVLAVLDNMLNKLSTTSKTTGETKAHKDNAKLLENNLHLLNGTPLTAREFANAAKNFPIDNAGRPSVHKATAILVQGVNDGILDKISPEKKSNPMRYVVAGSIDIDED